MGQYADVGGIHTWYDEYGDGDPLVLLHGGMCTNETWAAQVPAFAERFRVLAPERRGHGHTADVDGPLHYDDMASDTIGFLEQVVGGPAHLVGWSDGGIIGLLVAMRRPDLVSKLVVIGANYDTTGLAPGVDEMFAAMDPAGEDVAMFRDAYVAHSPDGADHWPVFFAKFIEMAASEPHIPVAELAAIAAPTLVVAGDDDVVSLEHTVALYRAVPGAELAVIPGTSHAAMLEKPALCNQLVLDFLENEPVPTMLPVRRAVDAQVHG
jgi:pimeloyl-ACP methyl ester carboxylesterase